MPLFREHICLTQNPGVLCFFCWGKLPLPRGEEIAVLPPSIAGVLRLQLNKSSALSLDIVYLVASGILVDPV